MHDIRRAKIAWQLSGDECTYSWVSSAYEWAPTPWRAAMTIMAFRLHHSTLLLWTCVRLLRHPINFASLTAYVYRLCYVFKAKFYYSFSITHWMVWSIVCCIEYCLFIWLLQMRLVNRHTCCSFFVVQLIAHCCNVVTFWKLWSELILQFYYSSRWYA